MKKIILLTAIMAGAVIAKTQQLQSSSLYDMQGVLHNASMAGIQQSDDVKGIAGITYRDQWSGISGSPKTMTIFGSFALPKHKIGVAGYVYNDQTGPTSRTGVELSLAKHILFND